VKLLPLALQQLERAMQSAWKCSGGRKPRLLEELEEILEKRKESPVEFKRKETLIICSENYKKIVIEEKLLRDYLQKTKMHIETCKKKNSLGKN